MRRMWWLAILVMGACTTQPMERARRWPNHRKETDTRFAELEKRAADLETKNSELLGQLVLLQRRVTKLEAVPPPAPSPPTTAGPAPSTP